MNKACLTLQAPERPLVEQRGTPWFLAWWVHCNEWWNGWKLRMFQIYHTWCSLSSWTACHCSLWRGHTFCLPSCSAQSEWRRRSLGWRSRTAGTCVSWRCSCWPGWCSVSSSCKPPSETRDRRWQWSCQTDGPTSSLTSNDDKYESKLSIPKSQTKSPNFKYKSFQNQSLSS